MALLGRIIVIVFAVMVASIAAGMAIAVGVLGPEWHGFTGDFGERAGFWRAGFCRRQFHRRGRLAAAGHSDRDCREF